MTPSKKFGWLQLMLVRGWLAQAESYLHSFLPPRNPICLVALEYSSPVAFAIVKSSNLRGSCWSISFPELISETKECSLTHIRQELIQSALKLGKKRAQSWLIRCSANDTNQIAISRELGFQPLKVLNCWKPKSTNGKLQKKKRKEVMLSNLEWQEVNNQNADSLWRLEQSYESSNLRQILDRQSRDLLQPKQPFNRVLISKNIESDIAVAGLISHKLNEDMLTIELIRDLAWDERLLTHLPNILNEIIKTSNQITLETAKEDNRLSELLIQMGWVNQNETILLGRSLWRRQENRKLISGTRPLDSMLGRLNPQQPPLPTPSMEPR